MILFLGTLLEGVEGIDETDRFKNFKLYNPANKAKAKFWDNKKETFVCQVGAKQNYNQVITDVIFF